MAGNLGYDTYLALDATHTFDQIDLDGKWISADDVMRVSASNLNGEFGTVVSTRALIDVVLHDETDESGRGAAP